MSISMTLEVENGAALEDIADILLSMGNNYERGDRRLDSFLTESGCQFSIRCVSEPESVVAEETSNVDWKVGLRGAFHCRDANLVASWCDIKRFVQNFAAVKNFRFVLSFQYEGVYAIRNLEGLFFKKEMIDE